MDLVLIGDEDTLAWLNHETAPSPEEFLIKIEDALEAGTIDLDEAIEAIRTQFIGR